MVHLGRPSQSAIAARLGLAGQKLSYPEVAATADLGSPLPRSLAATYDVDRHEFSLGTGRVRFERARAALEAWRHFEIPWLELHGATTPVRSDQVVATLISVAGLWFLNPCRVVYAELSADANLAAFAYGTLCGHVESGEERFTVTFNPKTQEVFYEIAAFSRPAMILTRLGYPLARRLQRRFALSSAEALVGAVG